MAALDTFEWFVTKQMQSPVTDVLAFIKQEREYLFSLRSEDERQRAVDAAIAELREMTGK